MNQKMTNEHTHKMEILNTIHWSLKLVSFRKIINHTTSHLQCFSAALVVVLTAEKGRRGRRVDAYFSVWRRDEAALVLLTTRPHQQQQEHQHYEEHFDLSFVFDPSSSLLLLYK